LLRFVLPYASQLLVYRATLKTAEEKRAWRLPLLVGALSISNISLSPEIGIAWFATVSVFSALLLRTEPKTALRIFVSEAAVIAGCALALPREYFHAFLSFSRGANNFPVLPAFHIVFYVVIALLCIPQLLATGVLERGSKASCVCGLGALSLALLPAALGRCDPSHVILNGYGLFAVAFALFAQSSPRRFVIYSVAYALIAIVAFQYSNARVYGVSPSRLGSGASRMYTALERLMKRPRLISSVPGDVDSVNSQAMRPADAGHPYAGFDKYESLGLPYGSYGYVKSLQQYLWSTHKIVPERYMAVVAVYDEKHMRECLAELSRIHRIVIQKNFLKLYENRDTCAEAQTYLKASFLYFTAPSCLHESFDPNIQLAKFIDQHYHVIDRIEDYLILEWNRPNGMRPDDR